MSFADPIGDMITRIRNAQMRTSNNVTIPNSKFRVKILSLRVNSRDPFGPVTVNLLPSTFTLVSLGIVIGCLPSLDIKI